MASGSALIRNESALVRDESALAPDEGMVVSVWLDAAALAPGKGMLASKESVPAAKASALSSTASELASCVSPSPSELDQRSEAFALGFDSRFALASVDDGTSAPSSTGSESVPSSIGNDSAACTPDTTAWLGTWSTSWSEASVTSPTSRLSSSRFSLRVVDDSLVALGERLGDESLLPCEALLAKVRAGQLGRKSGAGFYTYEGMGT